MILLGCLLLMFSLLRPAQAGVFGTAGLLKPGHFTFGLEPEIAFSPSHFILWIHGGLGLTRSIDLDVQLGLGADMVFGADLEFGLIRDTKNTPGLSFAAGAHGSSNLGLDATLLLSNNFRTFSFFGALDADIEFVDTGNETEIILPIYFDLGVAIPIARQMEFIFEGNIGITEHAASSLSGGVLFYF